MDPFDPIEALRHSAGYLRELRDRFGNLGLAAAAYNAGPGRVSAWLASHRPPPDKGESSLEDDHNSCRVARSLIAYLRNTQAMGERAMHTIALVSRKGGTGKSTLAIGLAVAAIEAGHRVCLLEADPLGTALGMRLGVTEYAPRGKSAEEIRGLWQWVWVRLSCASQPGAEALAHTHATLPAAVLSAGALRCVP